MKHITIYMVVNKIKIINIKMMKKFKNKDMNRHRMDINIELKHLLPNLSYKNDFIKMMESI